MLGLLVSFEKVADAAAMSFQEKPATEMIGRSQLFKGKAYPAELCFSCHKGYQLFLDIKKPRDKLGYFISTK